MNYIIKLLYGQKKNICGEQMLFFSIGEIIQWISGIISYRKALP